MPTEEERLQFIMETAIHTRAYATVYERTAWLHDIGEHEKSEWPYAFCPRCEMEHPKGAYRIILEGLKVIVDGEFDDVDPDDGLHTNSVRAFAKQLMERKWSPNFLG